MLIVSGMHIIWEHNEVDIMFYSVVFNATTYVRNQLKELAIWTCDSREATYFFVTPSDQK
jgi:hypothetical protein